MHLPLQPLAADGPSLCLPALPGIYGRVLRRGALGEGFVCSGATQWGHVFAFVLGLCSRGECSGITGLWDGLGWKGSSKITSFHPPALGRDWELGGIQRGAGIADSPVMV